MRQFRTETVGQLLDRHTDASGKTDAAALADALSPRAQFIAWSKNAWRHDAQQVEREDANDAPFPGEDARDFFVRSSTALWRRVGAR